MGSVSPIGTVIEVLPTAKARALAAHHGCTAETVVYVRTSRGWTTAVTLDVAPGVALVSPGPVISDATLNAARAEGCVEVIGSYTLTGACA